MIHARKISFIAVGGIALILGGVSLYNFITSRRKKKILENLSAEEIIALLEKRIQREEDGRAVIPFLQHLVPQQLLKAANVLQNRKNIIIITGFPSGIEATPSTEPNGPLGALCVARTLRAMGKNVVIATDESNEEVVLACAAASGLKMDDQFRLESFPSRNHFSADDNKRLHELAKKMDCILCIERPGPSPDGSYRNSTGLDITHLVSPLEMMLVMGSNSINADEDMRESSVKMIPSIGIAYGYNVLGMGKLYSKIVNSAEASAVAKMVVCIIPTDTLLLSTVANWGAYALSVALVVLNSPKDYNFNNTASGGRFLFDDRESALKACLPTPAQEEAMLHRMVQAGARDSISGKQTMSVDGMPLSASLKVLSDLVDIALQARTKSGKFTFLTKSGKF
eukprot:gene7534-15434_t